MRWMIAYWFPILLVMTLFLSKYEYKIHVGAAK